MDTVWVLNIPTCRNPSCTLGTKVTRKTSSLPLTTYKEFRRFMVSNTCIGNANKVAHQAGAYPGFCSMKRLGVLIFPTECCASPSQGYPPALNSPVLSDPFIHLGGCTMYRKERKSLKRFSNYVVVNFC